MIGNETKESALNIALTYNYGKSVSSSLSNCISSERCDAFESEWKQDSILISETGIESDVLDIEAAAIPCPADCGSEVDQASVARKTIKLFIPKIVADGETAVRSAGRSAEKSGNIHLIAGESGWIEFKLIHGDSSGVIPRLADWNYSFGDTGPNNEIA